MRAFKVTDAAARGVFTRFPWPTPVGDRTGAWVDAAHGAALCERGVHACHASALPYWLGPRVWEIELDGEIVEGPYKVVAERGRLIREVSGWPELARPFAQACAGRAAALAVEHLIAERSAAARPAAAAVTTEDWQRVAAVALGNASPLAASLAGFAADCLWDIDQGYFTMCAYVAATAFGCASTGSTEQDVESAGWHRERATQASWLAAHLDLTSGA